MVRQFQESYFDSRFQSTIKGYSAPRFDLIAQAYGIPGAISGTEASLPDALDWLWSTKGPALLDIQVSDKINVYPKLAFGRSFTEMEPQVKPLGMEST
jgi:acetolactate synthase-1/2/3 large subunit